MFSALRNGIAPADYMAFREDTLSFPAITTKDRSQMLFHSHAASGVLLQRTIFMLSFEQSFASVPG